MTVFLGIDNSVLTELTASFAEAQLYAGSAVDRDFYLDMLSAVRQPEMAKGYRVRMDRHQVVYP